MTRTRTRSSEPAARQRVVGYCRVSTEDQARSGLGLEDQQRKIRAAVEYRGWELIEPPFVDAGVSSRVKPTDRPGLRRALQALERGEADGLVVAKLDRLCRSVHDFVEVCRSAELAGWSVISLDPEIDMSSPTGRLIANIFAALGEWERDVISERVRSALAVKRSQGHRLGRPVQIDQQVRERIEAMRSTGATLQQISDRLNAEQVPTSRGGRWWPATVRHVLQSLELDREVGR